MLGLVVCVHVWLGDFLQAETQIICSQLMSLYLGAVLFMECSYSCRPLSPNLATWKKILGKDVFTGSRGKSYEG